MYSVQAPRVAGADTALSHLTSDQHQLVQLTREGGRRQLVPHPESGSDHPVSGSGVLEGGGGGGGGAQSERVALWEAMVKKVGYYGWFV